MQGFSHFFNLWRSLVQVRNGASYGKNLYFQEDRDQVGFALMPDFFAECGEEWAVEVTGVFETGSSLAARLDAQDISKFRMIQDRHLVNLAKMRFDDDYHRTSDERALFLIYHKVPPVRFSSAMSRAKNHAFDIIEAYARKNDASASQLLSAMSTAFMAEVHHTLRAYVYFERYNSDAEAHFEVAKKGDEYTKDDYSVPTRNRQMSMPDKKRHGSVELF